MNDAEKNMLKDALLRPFRELGEAVSVLSVLFPTAESVQSPPPTRESLLKRAEWARTLRPKERREQTLQIVEDSLHARELSVQEIFEAIYGDPAGQEYWRLGLKFASDAEVGKLLATHFRAENQDAAAAGHPYGWDWETCCGVALVRYPSGQPADRIRSIADDEELGYLVAPSAHAFLVRELPVQMKKVPVRNVSEADLTRFLNETATLQHTKRPLLELARKKFLGLGLEVPDRLFDRVYRGLPPDQRRGRGDHNRTLKAR
jgi:hypothetical protein